MIRGFTVFLSDSDINDPELSGDGTYIQISDNAGETVTHNEFITILARLCIYGAFGNGETRKAILGMIYDEVQKEVDRMYMKGEVYD